MNEMLNLSNINAHELSKMLENKVEFKKTLSKLSSDSRKDSKPDRCLYCSKLTTQFCNSHSIPASFLRNISVNGKCYINNEIIDLPLLDTEKGVNNSGTFHLICRECDNIIFKDYENPDNYSAMPTDKMIAQIAMKNNLKSISKRRFEIALYKNAQKSLIDSGFPPDSAKAFFGPIEQINTLDLKDYYRGFKRAKKIIEKGWKNEFYLFYYEKLNYVVPIAFQGQIALILDLQGNVINNNVYSTSPDYKVQTLNICVFPLKNSSIIMLFIDKHDKRYRSFYKQFKSLPIAKKLAAINFMIFRYSEDVYLSKQVNDIYLKNKELKDLTGDTGIQIGTSVEGNEELLREKSSFSVMENIPNFLEIKLENVG